MRKFEGVPDDIQDHIRDGRFKIENSKILSCVDGRTTKKQSHKGPSMVGGHFGILASTISVIEETEVPKARDDFRESIFNIVLDYAEGEENLYSHTDTHNCGKGTLGCGYVRLATQEETRDLFKITKESAAFIQEKIAAVPEKSNRSVVLEGEHEEQAVLIVKGTTHSIHPNLNGHQTFIHNADMVSITLKAIAQKLHREFNPNMSVNELFNKLEERADLHLMETSKKLAKGLSLYAVDISQKGEVESVKKVGEMPEEEAA